MQMSDYQRIEKAIQFIEAKAKDQPSLEEIATSVNLSPYHFQRMFSRWVGVTPKRFLQTLTLERAKLLLAESKPLLEVSDEVGLSTSSRLHDHFVQLEAVTPGQYKSAGKGLSIQYGLHQTPFGRAFIAQTERGICKIAFVEESDFDTELLLLKQEWPLASVEENSTVTAVSAADVFDPAGTADRPLSLYVRGTNFQVMVWKALLQIPEASVQSYSSVAAAIGKPSAVRAVGTAIGANPTAFIIPCHRVVQQSGGIGGYRWGTARKHAMHAWETARAS
jgi:AraC family transcriptional regulator, regulatory protein of adaptative response / methylated-DNA-[protein]-cysteine methyltransferase